MPTGLSHVLTALIQKLRRVRSIALTSALGMHTSISQHAQIHIGIIPRDEFPMSLESLPTSLFSF